MLLVLLSKIGEARKFPCGKSQLTRKATDRFKKF